MARLRLEKTISAQVLEPAGFPPCAGNEEFGVAPDHIDRFVTITRYGKPVAALGQRFHDFVIVTDNVKDFEPLGVDFERCVE